MASCQLVLNSHKNSIDTWKANIGMLSSQNEEARKIYNAFLPYVTELESVFNEFLATAHQKCPDEFLGKVRDDVAVGRHSLVLRKVGNDKYAFAKINKTMFGNNVEIAWENMGRALIGGGNYLDEFISAYDKSLNELYTAMTKKSTIATETLQSVSSAPSMGTTAAQPTGVPAPSSWQLTSVQEKIGVANPFSHLKNGGKTMPSDFKDAYVGFMTEMAYYKRYFPVTEFVQNLETLTDGYAEVLDADDATKAKMFSGELMSIVFTYPNDGTRAPHGIYFVNKTDQAPLSIVDTSTLIQEKINNAELFNKYATWSTKITCDALRGLTQPMKLARQWYDNTYAEIAQMHQTQSVPKHIQEAWDWVNGLWVQCKSFDDFNSVVARFQAYVNQPRQQGGGKSSKKKDGGPRHKYNGKLYKVHEGPRGGKYIVVDKKKVHI